MLNHRKLLLGTHSDATIANAYTTALQGSVVLVGPSSVCVQRGCVGVALLRFWRWEFGSVMGYDFLGFFYKWMLLRNGASCCYPAHIFWFHTWGQELRARVGTAGGHTTVGDNQSTFFPGLT